MFRVGKYYYVRVRLKGSPNAVKVVSQNGDDVTVEYFHDGNHYKTVISSTALAGKV